MAEEVDDRKLNEVVPQNPPRLKTLELNNKTKSNKWKKQRKM